MQCEVCGSNADKLSEIRLEGARVLACPRCAKLGTKVKKRPLTSDKKSAHFYKHQPKLAEVTEVIPDFGETVRKAREKKNLKREELAKKIFEKESVIQRIESSNFVPDDETVKKLEKTLEIKLTESEQ